jgi:hypothetical protein
VVLQLCQGWQEGVRRRRGWGSGTALGTLRHAKGVKTQGCCRPGPLGKQSVRQGAQTGPSHLLRLETHQHARRRVSGGGRGRGSSMLHLRPWQGPSAPSPSPAASKSEPAQPKRLACDLAEAGRPRSSHPPPRTHTRFSAAHTLAWPSRVFSFSLKHTPARAASQCRSSVDPPHAHTAQAHAKQASCVVCCLCS